MIVADLKARRPHTLPHRIVQAGETLCRMQFRSEADMKFFRNHLRWSAFEVVEFKPEDVKIEDAEPIVIDPAGE